MRSPWPLSVLPLCIDTSSSSAFWVPVGGFLVRVRKSSKKVTQQLSCIFSSQQTNIKNIFSLGHLSYNKQKKKQEIKYQQQVPVELYSLVLGRSIFFGVTQRLLFGVPSKNNNPGFVVPAKNCRVHVAYQPTTTKKASLSLRHCRVFSTDMLLLCTTREKNRNEMDHRA